MTLYEFRNQVKLAHSTEKINYYGYFKTLLCDFLPYKFNYLTNSTFYFELVNKCVYNELYNINDSIYFFGEDEDYAWYDDIDKREFCFKSEEIFLYYKLKYL